MKKNNNQLSLFSKKVNDEISLYDRVHITTTNLHPHNFPSLAEDLAPINTGRLRASYNIGIDPSEERQPQGTVSVRELDERLFDRIQGHIKYAIEKIMIAGHKQGNLPFRNFLINTLSELCRTVATLTKKRYEVSTQNVNIQVAELPHGVSEDVERAADRMLRQYNEPNLVVHGIDLVPRPANSEAAESDDDRMKRQCHQIIENGLIQTINMSTDIGHYRRHFTIEIDIPDNRRHEVPYGDYPLRFKKNDLLREFKNFATLRNDLRNDIVEACGVPMQLLAYQHLLGNWDNNETKKIKKPKKQKKV